MSLEVLRGKIDSLDTKLVKLLNERTRHALEIGKLKQKSGKGVYVPAREKAVFERVVSSNKGPLSSKSLRAIYREIMSAALSQEKKIKVAYQGSSSTFSHQAARSRFGGSVNYLSCKTIDDVFDSVEKKTADYGVVPVENSPEDAVAFTLNRLTTTSLKICAELYLPVSKSLPDTLESDGQNGSGTITRFLVIGHDQNMPSGDDKTSLLLAARHRAGALYRALESFKRFGLTMTKIESHPGRSKRFDSCFFVNMRGHAEDARVKKLITELARHCKLITILGSYPAADEKQHS